MDENRRAVAVYPREQRTAENLIEEFMILCNNTVAQDFFDEGTPSIYRVHEKPDASRMKELQLFLTNFGYKRIGFKNTDIQKILEESKGTPEENIIRTVVLRTMKKAVYSTKNVGHYGLASEAYTHFTSPIRRYPDLMVHRLVKGRMGEGREAFMLEKAAEHCSLTERQAIEAGTGHRRHQKGRVYGEQDRRRAPGNRVRGHGGGAVRYTAQHGGRGGARSGDQGRQVHLL